MGSSPISINGRPASPEGFQFFVDTLKAAGISVEGLTQGANLGHDDLFALLDQDKNHKLTQADFQKVNPGVFSDLRSVLGRYGFQLKDEMTVEPIVVAAEPDPAPASTPPASSHPTRKHPSAPTQSEPEPPAKIPDTSLSIPEQLGKLYGWKPEEVQEKYAALVARGENSEYTKNEPPVWLGEFGDGFLRGDFCHHQSWQASLGRFLGSLFNPFTNAVATGESVRTANEDPNFSNVLWAGLGILGTFAPVSELGKVRVLEDSGDVVIDGSKAWRRVRGRSAEQVYESLDEIPRSQLKLETAEELLLRENRVEIPGLRTPGKPRTISGPKGRLERSEALIKVEDLGTGSEVSEGAYYWIQDIWGLRHSDAGHVIGNQLGGKGGAYSNNLITQSPNINRGQYQLWEGQVAKMVRKNGSAEVEITIHYEDEAASIPDGITYLVRSGGVTYVKWFGNAH